MSERPHRVRTWAPRGQTPVLQPHFNWKVLSAAAGITWCNFYFRLYPGAIHAPEVIDFLGHLLRPCRASCWWSGTGCRSTGRGWSPSLSARSGAGWRSSGCRPTPRNSIRSNTSGVTGNITSCPTSARATSASSAIRRAAHCGACAGAQLWCARSGGKLICHYDMQVSNKSSARGSKILQMSRP